MAGILIVTTSSSLFRWTTAALAPERLPVTAHGSQFGIALAIAEQAIDLVMIDADFPGLDVPLTCYLLKRWRPEVTIVVLADRSVEPLEESAYGAKADGIVSSKLLSGEFARTVIGYLQQRDEPAPAMVETPVEAVANCP